MSDPVAVRSAHAAAAGIFPRRNGSCRRAFAPHPHTDHIRVAQNGSRRRLQMGGCSRGDAVAARLGAAQRIARIQSGSADVLCAADGTHERCAADSLRAPRFIRISFLLP